MSQRCTSQNLVPADGQLYLIKSFYQAHQADDLFDQLNQQLAWQQERIFIGGRWVDVPRLMCWYGDAEARYHYSGVDHTPLPWTDVLLGIKVELEQYCAAEFNSVLANLYRDGRDSMGLHADDEKELGKNPVIASLSFGERRMLRLRHKKHRGSKVEIELGHGDLLLMAGELQHFWRHELPKTRQLKQARINLTYRRIYPVQ